MDIGRAGIESNITHYSAQVRKHRERMEAAESSLALWQSKLAELDASESERVDLDPEELDINDE